MLKAPIPRLDLDAELRNMLTPFCRLKPGDIWEDKSSGHKVGCVNSYASGEIDHLMGNKKAVLAVHDPPYNFVAFDELEIDEFILNCKAWIKSTYDVLAENGSLYVWLGADQKNHFQPLPQFMMMMMNSGFSSKSFITMRNQRGYGTQKNWMAIRQELLYYTKGKPIFNIEAEYTDIPKVLKGYYKTVGNQVTSNMERSKSENIRAGNVWIDIQQTFYRMEENINGCFAQKPLKSCDRIIKAGSNKGDLVIDFFAHSGATLLSAEINERICYTCDIDPVFCEIAIRRLERYRETGQTGWQNSNPFYEEITKDDNIKAYLMNNHQIEY
ncbi:MAG: site-specific DNA-methyltransferase [Bacteroidota bacterium]|nr:site-specific DNA-methyltransferase [Bacteroidota bacterium]